MIKTTENTRYPKIKMTTIETITWNVQLIISTIEINYVQTFVGAPFYYAICGSDYLYESICTFIVY